MGYSLNERLIIVLMHSWKAQAVAFVMVCVTLGTFLLVKQIANLLAQSVLISEVAQTATVFHAEWVASLVVLFAMLVGFSEVFQREWRRISQG
ncbi:hypothetical protein [Thiothrix eikelboomii]|uniref:Uncharacterized protein n=1 Tax=Thiothrix eikelboomii TaxID=92487 RepID=A0A1T4W2N5_9GAMM|nr:hypothetical protein [Thiothrix eikelboomii]SKA71409.1 hypothetical protein SAMN02745130_00838 [Thiothrix eikelboomii]